MNERRSFAVLGGVTILVVAGVLVMRRGHGATASPPAARAERPAAVETAPAPATEAASQAEARRARDAMRAQILAALKRREAASPAPPPPAPQRAPKAPAPPPAEEAEPPRGHYEPSYIQQHFRAEMFPMMRQCYEGALARRPTLAGKLVLTFAIVGDPEVGGIVEDAAFADESDLKDEEMETCVRESLMTLTFDKPPTGGGKVTVRYPIAFAPGDDEDEKHAPERRPERHEGTTHAP